MDKKACPNCGAPVVQLPVGAPKKFCNKKCGQQAANRRRRRALPPLKQRESRSCVRCGGTFETYRRNHVYCSQRCAGTMCQRKIRAGLSGPRDTKCDGCGETFRAKTARARWCSRSCANRHYGLVRSRQRNGVTSAAMYTDLEIFERDGWCCHICKELVNRDVDRLHPDGATIDHLVPIAKGGTDDPSNVATAHWRCNRAKGSRLVAAA